MDYSIPFKKSICSTCKYFMVRFITDIRVEDYEDFGVDVNRIDIMDDHILEHRLCLLSNIDIDHTVLDCNKYKPRDENKGIIEH